MKWGLVFLFFSVATVSANSTQVLPSTPIRGSVSNLPRRVLDDVKKNLRVVYFSETVSPSLKNWNTDETVSTDDRGRFEVGSDPANTFHQAAFQYKVKGETGRIVVAPRFTTHYGATNRIEDKFDRDAVRMEDWRLGYQDFVMNNERVSWLGVAAVRTPNSRFSRSSRTNFQIEPHQFIDYKLGKWTLSFWQFLRIYDYADSRDRERWRLYNAPNFIYTFNDKWSISGVYENEFSHDVVGNKRDFNYLKSTMETAYLGFYYNVTPKFILYPFIKTPTLKRINEDTLFAGLWVIGIIN